MRGNVLESCLVLLNNGTTVPAIEYMTEYGIDPKLCGLSKVDKTKGIYAVYYDRIAELSHKGIDLGVCSAVKYKGFKDNMGIPPALIQSKIPKNEQPIFLIYFDSEDFMKRISS